MLGLFIVVGILVVVGIFVVIGIFVVGLFIVVGSFLLVISLAETEPGLVGAAFGAGLAGSLTSNSDSATEPILEVDSAVGILFSYIGGCFVAPSLPPSHSILSFISS